MDEVGGASMHATVSGNVHSLADDDLRAVQLVQRLLGFLPANNSEDPPHRLKAGIDEAPDEAMTALVPTESSTPLDARPVIAHLVDGGNFLEVHAGFAENIIVGFARVEGMVVGLIANQPTVRAGAFDINAPTRAHASFASATASTFRW